MTNDDIIKIAASKFSIGNPVVLEAVASAAVLMKDKQFKGYLEDRKNDMIINFNITHDGDFLTKRGVYEKIINEFFKEEEIEDYTERED